MGIHMCYWKPTYFLTDAHFGESYEVGPLCSHLTGILELVF
jgi:hypothetical protein